MARPEAKSPSPESPRLVSIDAYRGLVMTLMVAELLMLPRLAKLFPASTAWQYIGFHTSHVEWVGCSLHDLIQPSFSFLVGAALPFSIAARRGRGQSFAWMLLHAVWRAILLALLGIFLRSTHSRMTNFTFDDTLTQIGMGYVFLFGLGFLSQRWQWSAFAGLLLAYWAWFATYPAPGADFDWARAGVPADWPHHLQGFLAHWGKNSNPAAHFDRWFMNLFPRPSPFLFHPGGYATLSFIPTLATMILGLIAGGWLKSPLTVSRKILLLVAAGVAGLGSGYALHYFGICPIVKRIWTPAWTLYSGGWCCLMMAAFYAVCDGAGWRAWAFPMLVFGMNSIAIYCLAHLIDAFILHSVSIHLGSWWYDWAKQVYHPHIQGAVVMLILWLIMLWMYRQKLFIRI